MARECCRRSHYSRRHSVERDFLLFLLWLADSKSAPDSEPGLSPKNFFLKKSALALGSQGESMMEHSTLIFPE
jgi:hypothetical protein